MPRHVNAVTLALKVTTPMTVQVDKTRMLFILRCAKLYANGYEDRITQGDVAKMLNRSIGSDERQLNQSSVPWLLDEAKRMGALVVPRPVFGRGTVPLDVFHEFQASISINAEVQKKVRDR